MARVMLLVALSVGVACGGEGGKEPGVGPLPPVSGDPSSPPSPPTPISLGDGLPSVTPIVCTSAAELPAPPPPRGACDRPVAPGEPEVLSTVLRCAPGLGCVVPCGEVAVNATGAVAWWAVERLGGGGYVRGLTALLGPGGANVAPSADGTQPIHPAGDAFLRAGDLPAVHRLGPDGADVELELPWGVRWGPWFWPAYYDAPQAEGSDGVGTVAVVVSGLAEDGAGELWAAAVRGDGTIATPPIRLLSLPSGGASWGGARPSVLWRAVEAVAVGVDHAGRLLVLWAGPAACDGGGVAGRWFGPDGAALGPTFRAGDSLPGLSTLVPLPGGGLALRGPDGAWVRRFEASTQAGGPPPAWLAARAGETLTKVGDGLAVAARGGCDAGGRPPRLDLVGETGQVCATVELPPQECGLASPVPAVGADGTVVSFDRAIPIALPSGTLECRFRRWPRLLR